MKRRREEDRARGPRETDESLRAWGRLVAPIAAWVVLVVVVSHQPGWAAGSEPVEPTEARSGHAAETGTASGSATPSRAGSASGSGRASGAAVDGVAQSEAVRPPPPILYVPPSRGEARHTAGAGTRGLPPKAGAAGPRPQVTVLAPRDHVGLTSSPSPTLYWLLSAPTTMPIELSVVDDDAIEPLLQLRLPGPLEAGLHALDLAALGVVLPPNKIFRWFVALVHDPLRRSRDELAEGAIERVASKEPDRATAADGRSEERGAALRDAARRSAEQGRWYDALAALSQAIEQAPADRALAADRAALLDQARLAVALP